MITNPGHYESLLDELDLDERAALTAGFDDWNTRSLPEHGIPAIRVTDGPVGARGESYTSVTAALFPCGSALGATFDPALVGRIGSALGDEVRTKQAHVLLGPTLNLHRHPLGGRNFESYGEDPLLVSRLAVAFVRGLQSKGIGACPKHLVANDAEIERLTISSDVDEGVLREVYLRPFEAALTEGGAWTVMASYNRINGIYACEHAWLLSDVLLGEWGFDGLIISDWLATYTTDATLLAGTHLEMPGPARHLGPAAADAVRAGRVPADVVDDAARRVLRLADRVGASTEPSGPERSEDDPGRWDLAVEASAASMVLLRNRTIASTAPGVPAGPVLPLDRSLRRLAVIGPNAEVAVAQGGGSARVLPHRTVAPLAGLRARFPEADVVFTPGARPSSAYVLLDGRFAHSASGPGLHVDYRAERRGPVVASTTLAEANPVWSGRFATGIDSMQFHAAAATTLAARRTGPHELELASVGECTLSLDGEVVLRTDGSQSSELFFGYGTKPARTTVDLVGGEPHRLEVDYERWPGPPVGGFHIRIGEPLGADPIGDAEALAAQADAAVVVVGTDSDIECEGFDRTSFALGSELDELVRRVAAANARTAVVVNAGAAVDLPWLDEVGAVVLMWFPGMAGGEALAAVLAGDREPSGRLPLTIPVRIEDAPCDISRPDPPGHLPYTECLDIGHRSYLRRGVTPRAWFGEGGSYTTFEWGEADVAGSWSPGAPLELGVSVTNTGARSGVEVVQAYIGAPEVLGGFTKVTLEPAETRVVPVTIDPTALRRWDASRGWVTDPGPWPVRLARSAGDPGRTIVVPRWTPG
jgi:beta-glucosidase